jgi:hypothetical protein
LQNGRYFISDILSDGEGTMEMPIQDGKMKLAKFEGLEIEGYNNVKKKFIRCTIGNHISSDINVVEGDYDSLKNTITFDSDLELAPGFRTKNRLLFIFQDANHYKWEYYEEEKGKLRKATEIDFSRMVDK